MTESRASLASLSGARITSVAIVSESPELPGVARVIAPLHRASREATIRRQLLFAAGDSVDTLLVGETMRRLRRQRLFSDVVLQARRCGDGDLALLVRTRDTWTLRPRAQLRPGSILSLGVEERNFLGTGRSVALTSETSPRGAGAALSINDPWLLGSDVAGNLRVASLGGAHTLRAGLRNHEYSVFDRWHAEANVARLSFGDTVAADRPLHTLAAMVLVGRRVGSAPHAVTQLNVGAEFDSAASISGSRRLATSGTAHVRSFLGADLGISRRTAVFDTASWVVPGNGFLDVPLGWEGDAIVGGGYDRALDVPVLKVDAWMGRVWLPTRGSILMLDAWTSGYLGRLVDANHIERLSAAWYGAGWRGMWGARLTAERLLELDPDLRQLSLMQTGDYTAPVVRPFAARAGRALAGSVERSLHLTRVGAGAVLDAGAFLASSYRWQVADRADNQIRATVIGGRLRVLSANGAVTSVRIDAGYPVVLSDGLRKRPFAIVTIGTLFDVSRQRDGRRVY
ncbi:MAG: hypothetical protein JWN79_1637 [Gemmatimonadetes bacterium]|nr:hypothetical protein [Gemmatimonadota bacterium]